MLMNTIQCVIRAGTGSSQTIPFKDKTQYYHELAQHSLASMLDGILWGLFPRVGHLFVID
jgi:hypothetical protein